MLRVSRLSLCLHNFGQTCARRSKRKLPVHCTRPVHYTMPILFEGGPRPLPPYILGIIKIRVMPSLYCSIDPVTATAAARFEPNYLSSLHADAGSLAFTLSRTTSPDLGRAVCCSLKTKQAALIISYIQSTRCLHPICSE